MTRSCLLITALVAGCAPMINHPPRTDPGVYFGLTTGLAIPNDSSLLLAMTPMASPYVRYARRLENGWGVSGAVAASFGARYGFQGDLYAEVPSGSERWAHGVGVATAGNYTMPYAQLGRQAESGSGWYLTTGFVWRGYVDAAPVLFDTSEGDVRPRYLNLTLTGRRASRLGGLEGYVAGSLGHFDRRSYEFDPERPVTDTTFSRHRLLALSVGVTMEADLGRAFGGYREPRYPRRTPPPVPPPLPIP